MALGFETPLTTDARMQDLLERALLFAIGKDYRPKCAPIQTPISRKNPVAKLLSEKSLYLWIVIHKVTRRPVRIEQLRVQFLTKAFAESGFASGNATGDPDNGAALRHYSREQGTGIGDKKN